MNIFRLPLFFLLILMKCCHLATISENSQNSKVKVAIYESGLPPIKVGEKIFYVQTLFQANWFTAYQFCRQMGMQLASINNKLENDKLVEALKNAYGKRYTFWTSGNDLAQRRNYVWFSTGREFTYTNWRVMDQEPDHGTSPEERCVEIVKDSRSDISYDLKWNDTPCSREMYMICEKVK